MKWSGSTPRCDFCGTTGEALTEFVDGKTMMGPWAMMCNIEQVPGTPSCFEYNGIGLGTGLGQRYELQDDGSYKKVEG